MASTSNKTAQDGWKSFTTLRNRGMRRMLRNCHFVAWLDGGLPVCTSSSKEPLHDAHTLDGQPKLAFWPSERATVLKR
jgi:hypothetical protein